MKKKRRKNEEKLEKYYDLKLKYLYIIYKNNGNIYV